MPRPLQPCGTPAAYHRHFRNDEPPCEPCLTAYRAARAAYRITQGITPRAPASCGTPSGYQRHCRNQEPPCSPCRQAHNARVLGGHRRNRALRAQGLVPDPTPRTLKPCGTPAAYQRHLKYGETPCEPCREASREAARALRAARRAKKEIS